MDSKKLAASAAMAGALGLSALGVVSGVAQAKPHDDPWPPVPVICPGGPGVNCNGPGTPIPPGLGTPPPGHAGDPAYYGLPTVWAPDGVWWPAQNLVWNDVVSQWGVWWWDQFFPFPQQP